MANYTQLRERLLSKRGYHFTFNTDTEIIMHSLACRLRAQTRPDIVNIMGEVARDFDEAFNIVFVDTEGSMFLSRDPVGFRPLCWALRMYRQGCGK